MQALDRDALSRAIRKLATATSAKLFGDCYLHASLVGSVMQLLGVPSELHLGYAAWRVNGPQDHGVLGHHPKANGVIQKLENGIQYHAWLRVGPHIVDWTLYQLREKAVLVDVLDGKQTDVEWCPPYLWAPVSSCYDYREVARGYKAGMYCYERDVLLERHIKRAACLADEANIMALLVLYRSEAAGVDVSVHGPNGFGRL